MYSAILLGIIVAFTMVLTAFAIRAVMKATSVPTILSQDAKEPTWEDFLDDVYGGMSFDDLFEKWRTRYPGRKRPNATMTHSSLAKITQALICPRLVIPVDRLIYDTKSVTSAGTQITTQSGIHYMFAYNGGRESSGNNA